LLSIVFAYQFLSANRLLQVLISDDLMSRTRGLGVWREIYYILQKINRTWSQKLAASEEQQAQFIQTIQASPNGILVLDEGDRIEWCNEVSGRHLGLDTSRDFMQHITHLLRKPSFIQYINGKEYSESIEIPEMGPRASLVLSIQIFPYGLNKKLMLTQDITQRKQNESMRRDFIANVSHELKTPLTVMGGFLETIHELPLSEADRKRYIELMIVQSNQMRSLVDDLLILTKLESSPPPPSINVIEVKDLLKKLETDAISLSKESHQIEVECQTDKNIQGDEKEIFSAFGNLVSNAIRYTPVGGRIQLKWTELADGGCEFSVRDSGPGIEAEHIPRLTERFYRVDSSRSRDSGGTGLGLAIVKYIVIRHNATLVIKSEIGRGSLFAIDFPQSRVK
jgi:two-component system phosphate regulon sensor histidine kinase PhoR